MSRSLDRSLWVVARREFLERVRSKWFLVGTLLGPLAMLAVIFVPALLAGRETAVSVAIVDRGAVAAGDPARELLAKELVAGLSLIGWIGELAPDATEASLLAKVRERKLNGFLVIPEDVLGDGEVIYRGDNGTNAPAMARLAQVVTAVVQRRRGAAAGISDAQVLRMMAPVRVTTQHTTGEAAGASGMATFIIGYVIMFILYLAIILYASNVMRSVVQEKTSRVVELMVAAVKPRALMGGKIAGVGAVGLLQLVVWLGMAVLTLRYRDSLLGLLGVKGTGGVTIPPLSIGEVTVILIYFLLGYFLYAALYAAVGAMVSSEQEAQQAQMPVMALIIVGLACVQIVANDPRGTGAVVLTNLPTSSPLLMPMRYLLGGASAGEVIVSLLLLVVAMAAAVIAAGRIYRVGILMHGKRPGLRELLHWMRR
ncbi:MAG: ABC transporter permease [Kofleriaceae bacterium]